MPVRDIGQDWATAGDTVTFAVHLGAQLAARWDWRTDSLTLFGRLPPSRRRAISVAMLYGRSEILPTRSGYVALLPAEQGVDVFDRNGIPTASVIVPAARRRGEPPDLFDRQIHLRRDDPDPILASSSAGIALLPSGETMIAKLDMRNFSVAAQRSRFGDFRLYVSLLSPDLTRACVDALVPVSTDVAPIPLFTADTMFVLSRTVRPDNTVKTMLYALVIRDDHCDWVPTTRVTVADTAR